MRRRELFKISAVALLAFGQNASGQQPPTNRPRIGFLLNFRNENFESLAEGLHKAGYIDGQNVKFRGACARYVAGPD